MPYLIRLLSLGLASFFLLNVGAGAILAALAPAAVRMAGRMDPRRAARFLFAIRLFPSAFSCLLVVALCVPSYIRLEPEAASESVGVFCLAAAVLGAVAWGISLFRGVRAIAGSAQFLRDCRRSLSKTSLPGQVTPVWVVENPALVFALAGVIRPRFVISSEVLTVLSPYQLELALLHERAHNLSHDNFKRLLVILTPDPIPFVHPPRAIEQNRAKFTEWAADDEATGGDADRSLSLAATLVSVARAGAWPNPSPLLASFVNHSGADLEARVDRLIEPAASQRTSLKSFSWLVNAAFAVIACAIVLLALNPPVLSFVHEILEHLIA